MTAGWRDGNVLDSYINGESSEHSEPADVMESLLDQCESNDYKEHYTESA